MREERGFGKTERTWNRVDGSSVGRVLSKDNGQSGFQMPVNVTMEEPRSRVVSLFTLSASESHPRTHLSIYLESDCNVVASGTKGDNITADRVSIVVS